MEEKLNLIEIKGVGEKLSTKILDSVGGQEALEKIVQEKEIEKLSSIDGISQRKAVEIMNQLLGNPNERFLKSPKAVQIYDQIIENILSFTNTRYAHNRVLLLSPTTNQSKIRENLGFVEEARELVSTLPVGDVRRIMRHIREPVEVKGNYDASKVILVESSDDYDYMLELGLNNYYPILVASRDLNPLEMSQYNLILYVYDYGGMDISGMDNIVMIHKESDLSEIIPDTVIDYYRGNRESFNEVVKLKRILGEESVLEEACVVLDEIEKYAYEHFDIDTIVEKVRADANEEIKNSIEKLDLDGDKILELLSGKTPPEIDEILEETLSNACSQIQEETRLSFDPFIKKYPIEIDNNELRRIKQQESSRQEIQIFEKKTQAASQLKQLKPQVEKEIQDILEFDYKFALGAFTQEYNLHPAKIGDKFHYEEIINLNLIQENIQLQKVNYQLYPENVTLLTGANSGGKTTLLETVAQISILAQMGLPVPGENVEVKILDELYFFSKQRSLDAGAFESFLDTFIPALTTNANKLILLDELEGITELDAAVKIISSIIEIIEKSSSYAIIVTHMAQELIEYSNVRVDGIEAKGLDEDYNLIVDRTPKMNYLARSTPELILKKIYQQKKGEEKEIYGEILKKF